MSKTKGKLPLHLFDAYFVVVYPRMTDIKIDEAQINNIVSQGGGSNLHFGGRLTWVT